MAAPARTARRRPPVPDLFATAWLMLQSGGAATVPEMARAWGFPTRTVERALRRARKRGGAVAAASPAPDPDRLTAGDRRHLCRTYGRSTDPAVQEWLRSQARPSA